jgi:hypothetical protein
VGTFLLKPGLDHNSKTFWHGNVVSFDNNIFLHCFEKKANNFFYCWIYILGDQRLADQYHVSLQMDGNGVKFKTKVCKVFSIDTKKQHIMGDDVCFQLHERQIKQIRLSGGLKLPLRDQGYTHVIKYSYTISKRS